MSTSTLPTATPMDLSHLRRSARTALELALVAPAPIELIEQLATVSGLLEALAELPADSPPMRTLGPSTAQRARDALAAWGVWSVTHQRLA